MTAVNALEGKKWIGRHGTDVGAILLVQKAVQRLVARKFSGWSLADREDLESLVMEKYIGAFGRTALPSNPSGEPSVPIAWLTKVVANAGVDAFRKQKARPADLVDFAVPDDPALEARLVGAIGAPRLSAVVANRVDLLRALDALGDAYPSDRSLIQWRIVEDLPLADVAILAGKTDAATKKAIQRATVRLRDLLQTHVRSAAARAAARRVARRS